ncbi:hypothetical protein [Kitasatospora indigofera]|uniref:hypothetical protein n=1 Tax=Kitasatospora indigofera TaxID=67307 RepID=UPI0033A1CAEE
MSHIPDHVLRTLWYINTLDGRGFSLSASDVENYACATPPRDADRSTFGTMAALFEGSTVRRAEKVLNYLLQVGWAHIKQDGFVRLTPLGRTVLAACSEDTEPDGAEPEVADIALDPDDPLVYVALTRRLLKAGAGLLVDSYFKAESLVFLIEATHLRRILISGRGPKTKAEKERASMAVALGTIPNASEVEVRFTMDPALHDRCVIGADHQVQLLGSSVNGVGRHLTAVITPSDTIAEVYRRTYEDLWNKATPITPQHPTAPPAAAVTEEAASPDA